MTQDEKYDWVFRIQLISLFQNQEVLNLLRFPSHHLLPQKFQIEASFWSKGHTTKIQHLFEDIESVISEFLNKKVNKILLSYYPFPYRLPKSDLLIKKINAQLDVSPTNLLWETIFGYEPSSAGNRAIRRTFESKEISLKRNSISSYPTLLDCSIELQTSLSKDKAYQKLFDLLPSFIPIELIDNSTVGCAELLSKKHPTGFLNILNNLAPWPKTYLLLDQFFDDIHPILIGPLSLCNRFVDIFDDLRLSIVSKNSEDILGVVLFSEASLQEPDNRIKAQALLVPKDQTTASSDGQENELEEMRVELTGRKWRELSMKGMVPQLLQGWSIFQIIQPKYCLMLGIDVNDMFVRVMQDEISNNLKQEIDSNFEELPPDLSIVERVWIAHESAWLKWSFDCKDILSSTKRTFFHL